MTVTAPRNAISLRCGARQTKTSHSDHAVCLVELVPRQWERGGSSSVAIRCGCGGVCSKGLCGRDHARPQCLPRLLRAQAAVNYSAVTYHYTAHLKSVTVRGHVRSAGTHSGSTASGRENKGRIKEMLPLTPQSDAAWWVPAVLAGSPR